MAFVSIIVLSGTALGASTISRVSGIGGGGLFMGVLAALSLLVWLPPKRFTLDAKRPGHAML